MLGDRFDTKASGAQDNPPGPPSGDSFGALYVDALATMAPSAASLLIAQLEAILGAVGSLGESIPSGWSLELVATRRSPEGV